MQEKKLTNKTVKTAQLCKKERKKGKQTDRLAGTYTEEGINKERKIELKDKRNRERKKKMY